MKPCVILSPSTHPPIVHLFSRTCCTYRIITRKEKSLAVLNSDLSLDTAILQRIGMVDQVVLHTGKWKD